MTKTSHATIETLFAVKFQSAAEWGLEKIAEVLLNDIAVHNEIVLDLVSNFADPTEDRQRIYGSSVSTELMEVDEHGQAPTARETPGSSCGFPLKKFQRSLGWNADWFKVHTPNDMAVMVTGIQKAHLKMVRRELMRALYLSTNYTWNDFLIDKITLATVRRLLNGDSEPIPDGPNGETFDGATHSHYNFAASLTAAALLANINDVVEHGHGADVKVAISTADEATVRGLSGFTAYVDPRVTLNANANEATQRLDITRLDNRAIGLFGAAEVWVKPWAIATYPLAWDAGTSLKPLVYRQRPQGALQGLRLVAEYDNFPLHVRTMEAEFGFGVWTRSNGAILYAGSAGAYADPTIA